MTQGEDSSHPLFFSKHMFWRREGLEISRLDSNEKGGHHGPPFVPFPLTSLAPVVIPVVVVIAIMVLVPILPHIVSIPISLVAIAVSISFSSYLSAAVPPPIICIVVVSAAVIRVMVVPDHVIAEARIVPESRLVLASPFPIFPLAFVVQPVVLDIVIAAFSQPLAIIRVVVSVVASGAVIRVISSIPVLCASGGHDCSQSQS